MPVVKIHQLRISNLKRWNQLLGISIVFFILNFKAAGQSNVLFNKYNTIGYSYNFVRPQPLSLKGMQHKLSYQKIINRKLSFVMDYAFSKNQIKFDLPNKPNYILNVYDSSSFYPKSIYVLSPVGEAYFRSKLLSMGFRTYLYAKGAIAPFGSFIEVKAAYAKLTQKQNEDNVRFIYNDAYIPNQSLSKYPITHLEIISLQLAYGVSKPLYKNISFDWVVNFNLNAALWKGDVKSSSVYYRDLYMYRNSRELFVRNNTVRLNLGIHYGF